ncbi:tetratricopeptide repeat protein [Evansella cellulosilytica]|uniref:Tetratricopeptide TPR_1 repeat-containing protein n=1 Tax=Evansella cellulosilytica (strain ATCC 21833 / DSM 2522 / FERM P-1141 / JCM 9156 / N-4) TaxID=649639 RepID=E6TRE3_EVAC2|nr:tetratricopeptide repeat protein [Evansella cellulosilytica]ADU31773.1 Tetratricopeptide TPR_1 repeat-containing protein [Evansella cellulosilytica DSM 2522]
MSEQSKKKGQIIPFMQDGAYFYKKGIEAYQNRQIDQSINYIERAIRIEPQEPVFLCQLAIVLSEKEDYHGANALLNRVLTEVDPNMAECHFFIANNAAHIGEFDEAQKHLERYLEMEPDGEFKEDAESLLYMIEEEGIDFLQELENFPLENPVIDRIVDYLNKGDYEWAEKEARGFLMEEPKEWDVYAYLAESLMYQGDLTQAKSILQDLLMKEEPNFIAQCLMTELLYKKDEQGKDVWVKNLIHLRPIKDWHCYYLAKTLFAVKKYDQSYKWFKKLYINSEFDKHPAYFHQMAIVAWKNGFHERARLLWEKTRKLDKENEHISKVFLEQLSESDEHFSPEDGWFIYALPTSELEGTTVE